MLRRSRHLLTAIVTLAALLAPAAAARASTATDVSTNWAGYAVHRAGVSYTHVTGTWRVPEASCTSGDSSYSATWVGIGGYRTDATALEQLGTETDCSLTGQSSSSAWFEIVPAPSRTTRLTVHPGDTITASVTITGHRVTLALRDRTRGTGFTKTLTARTLDTSSAEWIVEAPSACASSDTQCETLPLADFGSVGFTNARATDRAGQTGSITSALWDATKIVLATADHAAFVSTESTISSAVPTALASGGSAFSVAYDTSQAATPQPGQSFARTRLQLTTRR